MTTNEQLLNAAIRHAIHSERYGRGLAARTVKLLDSVDDDILAQIDARLATKRATAYLEDRLEAIRLINEKVYSKVADGLRSELIERSTYEAEWQADTLNKAVAVDFRAKLPTPTLLETLVSTTPIDGFLLASWVDEMPKRRLARIEQQLRIGIAQGDTVDSLTKRVQSVLPTSRQSAEALAITANSTVANAARAATYQANSDVIKGVQWRSVLDTRTSSICQSRDGKFYELDKPHPTPPAHIRCRSVMIPITKSYKELGLDKEEADAGTRASMGGQVPATQNYGDWLKNQPEARQNEILGASRAQLFRDGQVKFDDLFRDDGSYRSLDELRGAEGIPAPKPQKPAKTVQPTTPPEPVNPDKINQREREYVLKQGKATGNEHLVAYDEKTGEILERKQGGRSSVEFSPALARAIKDPDRSIVLHHNHPRSTSLSLPDMQVVANNPGAKSIWAHGHNGSSYYAEQGKLSLNTATVNALAGALHSKLQSLVNDRALAVEDAALMHNHLTWLALTDLEQIIYRADLQGSSREAWERNKAVFTRILESLK